MCFSVSPFLPPRISPSDQNLTHHNRFSPALCQSARASTVQLTTDDRTIALSACEHDHRLPSGARPMQARPTSSAGLSSARQSDCLTSPPRGRSVCLQGREARTLRGTITDGQWSMSAAERHEALAASRFSDGGAISRRFTA